MKDCIIQISPAPSAQTCHPDGKKESDQKAKLNPLREVPMVNGPKKQNSPSSSAKRCHPPGKKGNVEKIIKPLTNAQSGLVNLDTSKKELGSEG